MQCRNKGQLSLSASAEPEQDPNHYRVPSALEEPLVFWKAYRHDMHVVVETFVSVASAYQNSSYIIVPALPDCFDTT